METKDPALTKTLLKSNDGHIDNMPARTVVFDGTHADTELR